MKACFVCEQILFDTLRVLHHSTGGHFEQINSSTRREEEYEEFILCTPQEIRRPQRRLESTDLHAYNHIYSPSVCFVSTCNGREARVVEVLL